jgi:hypothetical protein
MAGGVREVAGVAAAPPGLGGLAGDPGDRSDEPVLRGGVPSAPTPGRVPLGGVTTPTTRVGVSLALLAVGGCAASGAGLSVLGLGAGRPAGLRGTAVVPPNGGASGRAGSRGGVAGVTGRSAGLTLGTAGGLPSNWSMPSSRAARVIGSGTTMARSMGRPRRSFHAGW